MGAPHKRGSRLISYQSAAIAAELAATARQWAADVGASFGRWCINGSDSSDTSDDCERSQRKCNSSCGLLNEGRLGDVVVGHWFEVSCGGRPSWTSSPSPFPLGINSPNRVIYSAGFLPHLVRGSRLGANTSAFPASPQSVMNYESRSSEVSSRPDLFVTHGPTSGL